VSGRFKKPLSGRVNTAHGAAVAALLQLERLEAQLQKLGTLHNRAFSAREREIREGLQSGDRFEVPQVLPGQHLGFAAGKRETDASPDPWWQVSEVVIVFEDHANQRSADATSGSSGRIQPIRRAMSASCIIGGCGMKARQVATHSHGASSLYGEPDSDVLV
jgi:hypothetical protein